ncbi:HEPN domain-containing protein [Candidatus Pacearchaeota archaeon]|nr:HEPN domain-containing protein [Candidatus Pacearchaeota archaeon]
MKKINFLSKLRREGKLEIVEPSEEMKKSYILKSESNLTSAKILLNNNRLEESVSLAYYSMYHLLIALLFKIGIKSENHSGSINPVGVAVGALSCQTQITPAGNCEIKKAYWRII